MAFEVIDMRSFSNLWFWIALAVLWSTASHYVIGVPYDMVTRAKRGQVVALADVENLANVYARRLIYIAEVSGLWITGFLFFVLTALVSLGFFYGIEFAQAIALLAVPMSLVGALSVHTARKIPNMAVDRLLTHLRWHRVKVQAIGVVSIFVTSMWGMWTNMNVNVLGG
jgi:hypothetical protein